MQAVILAAGRGTRMKELTDTVPKPMIPINGKPILEHKLEALPDAIDEVIMVVGYHEDAVRRYFGDVWDGRPIRYVVQENPTGGTADALWKAKSLLHDRFLVMNGDNLYSREDMESCLPYAWAVLVQEREHIVTGRVVIDAQGFITDIAENSGHGGERGYANTALYALDMRFFDYPPVPKAPGSTELGLPQTMLQAVGTIPIKAVPAAFWFETKSPEDIRKAEEILKNRKS